MDKVQREKYIKTIGCLEVISKTDKPLAKPTFKKTQIINYRNSEEAITTNIKQIRIYYVHIYSKRFDKLEEMDMLFERNKLSK